jgi:hypothetical protein
MPRGVATVTSTAPAAPAGAIAVITLSLSTRSVPMIPIEVRSRVVQKSWWGLIRLSFETAAVCFVTFLLP